METSHELKMRNTKQNNLPAFFKNVKIKNDNERQRKVPFLRKLTTKCNV